jgi:dihydropteroate synthase
MEADGGLTMLRKRFEWRIRDNTLLLGERTLLMGVLNVTPDSFSDGGRYDDPDRAYVRAMELEDEGADVIDVGAESTRPGSQRISEAEELRRLIPVLKRLRDRVTVPLSVDTYKSGVARKALELGVAIVNDPSALTFDPELARVAAQFDAGLVLNHMRGTPETWARLPPLKDVAGTVAADLGACVHRATQCGVTRARIMIDPGLGFGKRREQNTEILAQLSRLAALDLPILVGPSRKSFLAQPSEQQTEMATAAAVTAAILGGAHMVRVHDIEAIKPVVQVADAVVSASL